MSEAGYNGHTNWATYTIANWLNNQEDENSKWTERAKELLEEKEYNKSDAISELADELEKDWEDKLAETGHDEGPLYDFMHSELNVVDWQDIAESYFAELEVFVAQWDDTTQKFGDFDSARDAVHDALVDLCDETGDDPDDEDTHLGNLISEVSNKEEPFTVEYDGTTYEVAKDE